MQISDNIRRLRSRQANRGHPAIWSALLNYGTDQVALFVIRHYGLLSNRDRSARIAQARALMAMNQTGAAVSILAMAKRARLLEDRSSAFGIFLLQRILAHPGNGALPVCILREPLQAAKAPQQGSSGEPA